MPKSSINSHLLAKGVALNAYSHLYFITYIIFVEFFPTPLLKITSTTEITITSFGK